MSVVLTIVSYSCGILLDAFLIFFALFQIISFDELRADYRNPIDLCKQLNPLVLPEYLIHSVITALFLISGQWFSLLINVPLVVYHIQRYRNRPLMTDPGVYDPTTIMYAKQQWLTNREAWIRLAFYLTTFFYYLVALIYVLIHNF
ncbi:unnamed protein product [Medioppia subpectinata]|uniref:Protein cornichon n=1 Tax=Medioppia subpectinata TaxID=1979941 RepID=A0A7R9L364_9ACAR|nr:unnamed protein product [Medioppia subpectinata]CAG2114703.1 unnamed protein product [Medioppia subpectinata]